MFDFLFLCQFAENHGFQIHPCPYKGHKLIVFYGFIVFHCVYVPHFPCPVYHQWAFGLVPGLRYCKQCHNLFIFLEMGFHHVGQEAGLELLTS